MEIAAKPADQLAVTYADCIPLPATHPCLLRSPSYTSYLAKRALAGEANEDVSDEDGCYDEPIRIRSAPSRKRPRGQVAPEHLSQPRSRWSSDELRAGVGGSIFANGDGERFGLSKDEIPVRGNKNGRYCTTQYLMGRIDARGRATVAAYYADDPQRWLPDMQRFLSDKISEANLRTVMRQTTALATGAGVAHTVKFDAPGHPARFRQGEPISIGCVTKQKNSFCDIGSKILIDSSYTWVTLDIPNLNPKIAQYLERARDCAVVDKAADDKRPKQVPFKDALAKGRRGVTSNVYYTDTVINYVRNENAMIFSTIVCGFVKPGGAVCMFVFRRVRPLMPSWAHVG